MNIKPLTSTRAAKVNHVKTALHFLHANKALKHGELVSILVIPALTPHKKNNITTT